MYKVLKQEGRAKRGELTDATWDERVAVICLIVCVAGLGMAPFWVSHMIGESVLPVVSQLIP